MWTRQKPFSRFLTTKINQYNPAEDRNGSPIENVYLNPSVIESA